MPPILSSPSGEQYHIIKEKIGAIANISFSLKPDDIATIAQDAH
jgi:hypothetical protein